MQIEPSAGFHIASDYRKLTPVAGNRRARRCAKDRSVLPADPTWRSHARREKWSASEE